MNTYIEIEADLDTFKEIWEQEGGIKSNNML